MSSLDVSSSVIGTVRVDFIFDHSAPFLPKGPFKCYVTQMGVGGVRFSGKKRYEGVRFNVICVTRGWVGSNFQKKSVT